MIVTLRKENFNIIKPYYKECVRVLLLNIITADTSIFLLLCLHSNQHTWPNRKQEKIFYRLSVGKIILLNGFDINWSQKIWDRKDALKIKLNYYF